MLPAMAVEYAINSSQIIGVVNWAMNVNEDGRPSVIAMAETAVPVLKRMKKPKIGPRTGMNIIRQIMKLFPKIYVVSAPFSFSAVTVLLRSLLMVSASWALMGTIVPKAVKMTAKTNIAIMV
jgi:hypothetical protein